VTWSGTYTRDQVARGPPHLFGNADERAAARRSRSGSRRTMGTRRRFRRERSRRCVPGWDCAPRRASVTGGPSTGSAVRATRTPRGPRANPVLGRFPESLRTKRQRSELRKRRANVTLSGGHPPAVPARPRGCRDAGRSRGSCGGPGRGARPTTAPCRERVPNGLRLRRVRHLRSPPRSSPRVEPRSEYRRSPLAVVPRRLLGGLPRVSVVPPRSGSLPPGGAGGGEGGGCDGC
jgi:hypothetical protein